MPRHETEEQAQERRKVERLVEAVEDGSVEALEDLSPEDLARLLTTARKGESLEDLFDRLRRADPERSRS